MTIQNFINGQYVSPQSGQYLDNYHPASGLVYGKIPNSNPTDVDTAVEAAKKAFPAWAALPPEQRCDILLGIAEGISELLNCVLRTSQFQLLLLQMTFGNLNNLRLSLKASF